MIVLYVGALVLGMAVGSFVNVLIYRVPLKKSIVYPPSHCPYCNTPITWYDNIPLVSYFVLRAKCRACGEPISARYPIVEAVCGFMFVWAAHSYGLGVGPAQSVRALVAALFLVTLLALALIDLDHRILPDVIVLPWLAVGAVIVGAEALLKVDILPLTRSTALAPWPSAPARAVTGLLLGGGLLFLLAVVYRGGMGGGDIKLTAVLGLFLGPLVLFNLFVGVLLGSATGLYLIAVRGANRKDMVPFGPFLVIGAYVTLLWGERIVEAYLRLVGLS